MDGIVLPGRDELSARLRDLAAQPPRTLQGGIDDLELRHLVEVVFNHALLMTDVFKETRLGRVIGNDGTFRGLLSREEDLPSDTIHQIRRIPDDIKMIGDKCLYDVGLFGRVSYGGHDLTALGQKSYRLAAEVLEVLADDRRLKEYFRQNRLWNLPIEGEIGFLRQCGTRFTLHAELLRALHLFEGRVPGSGQSFNQRPQPTEGHDVTNSSLNPSKDRPRPSSDGGVRRSPAEASGLESAESRRFSDAGLFAGGMMEEKQEFVPEELKPSMAYAEMDRLPRKDLLSLYERMLLFSALDIDDLRTELKSVVIDQQEAVDTLCDELSLYATGCQSLSRPASYFFVGPTGVGKNHLIESMVRALEKRWDFQIPVLQLEGPQYTYPSDINELKGAARGFIRSDEEGILTEFYSRSSQSPYSVILVDEVEKSHPQLRKFFLSLMDRGTTMDNRGQMLNFVNSMIVYTSNIGYSRLQTQTQLIGFHETDDHVKHQESEVMRDLKKILSPEFVNRLTVIKFRALSRESIESIFDLEAERIANRYQAMHSLELTITPRARMELIHRGYNPEFGARPLSRLMNGVCNIEVSKKLKRDEVRSSRADRSLREYIREVKEGKRAYDAASMQRRVMTTARIQVPYRGVAVDYDGSEFLYLPQGQERGSH